MQHSQGLEPAGEWINNWVHTSTILLIKRMAVAMVMNNGLCSSTDILHCCNLGTAGFHSLRAMCATPGHTTESRLQICHAVVVSIILHTCAAAGLRPNQSSATWTHSINATSDPFLIYVGLKPSEMSSFTWDVTTDHYQRLYKVLCKQVQRSK